MRFADVECGKAYKVIRDISFLQEGAIVVVLHKDNDRTIFVQDISPFKFDDGQWWVAACDLEEV